MKKQGLYICVFLYATAVHCDRYKDVDTYDYDSVKYSYDRPSRDRRWQVNYRYEETSYQPQRRDYQTTRQESLPRIISLLEDISAYLKRPQTSHLQPIYIPYPILFPISIPVSSLEKETPPPSIKSRGPELNVQSVQTSDYEEDGARPISLEPIKPDRAQKRLTPQVEHGSVQEAVPVISTGLTTDSRGSFYPESTTGKCSAAIVTCCSEKTLFQRRSCLYKFGCAYSDGGSCQHSVINSALDSLNNKFSTQRY